MVVTDDSKVFGEGRSNGSNLACNFLATFLWTKAESAGTMPASLETTRGLREQRSDNANAASWGGVWGDTASEIREDDAQLEG